MDIEWAFGGGQLAWLQLREITSLKNLSVYSNRISKEFLPGMIKPLVWSVNIPLVNGAWIRFMAEAVGDLGLDPHEMSKSFHYRAYFSMSAMAKFFERLGLPDEMLEVLQGIESVGPERPSFRMTPELLALMPKLSLFAIDKACFGWRIRRKVPELRARYAEFLRKDFASMQEAELLASYEELFKLNSEAAYHNIVTMLLYFYNWLLKSRASKYDIDLESFDIAADVSELAEYDPSNSLRSLGEKYRALSTARYYYEESEQLYRELGNQWYQALSLALSGIAAEFQGEYSVAATRLEERQDLFRKLKDGWGLSIPLMGLGLMAFWQADYATARSLFEEALGLRREQGDPWNVSESLNLLGEVVQHQGEPEKAVSLYAESLALDQVIGDREKIAVVLHNLGSVAIMQGRQSRAARLFGAAQAVQAVITRPFTLTTAEDRVQDIASARIALGEEQFSNAWTEGRGNILHFLFPANRGRHHMYDKDKLNEIAQARDKWEETTLHQAIGKLPERAEEFITASSEAVARLYTPLDIVDLDYVSDLGFPGDAHFTRGVHPTLYRSRLWTMRMFAGFGSVEETNARFKYLLEHGQTGLSIAFDLPTLYGYDTDSPEGEGEFGKCGVAVSSLKDMEILLDAQCE